MIDKCLVLGANGFIGSHLTARLLEIGYTVRILIRPFHKKLGQLFLFKLLLETKIIDMSILSELSILTSDSRKRCFDLTKNYTNKLEILFGDFQDVKTIEEAIKGIDCVFHLVCTTTPSSSNKNLENDISTNLLPSINLMNMCRDYKVSKLIFFSSGGTVYGLPESIPIEENHPSNPICSYGIHKLAVENYMYMFYKLYGLKSIVLRLSNPYGPGQNIEKKQGVLSTIINNLLSGNELEIWGDGTVIRDYIYISDVVNACIKSIQIESEFCILNIGSGKGFCINDITAMVEEISGKKLNIVFKAQRNFDVPVNILSIKKTVSVLGWQPKVPIELGISQMLKYIG